ncbi:MarR family winged helix-turn-helix transcriptional regulator [Williamsia muralis]|uniref:MarR family winged helix-turn-helix transcriptional regulator n=1 Tax=Williamsia marianensis TaxID=85044 RepID=UPI00167164EE|nr:MarR family transcriptional regulator [Williamsia marianensis]
MQHDKPTPVIAHELSLAIARLRARLRVEQSGISQELTVSQLSALGRIVESGKITAADLAQSEHVRAQSMAETIGALRQENLIVSTPDPNDGRKKLVSATVAGQRLIESIVQSRNDWLAHAIDDAISAQERETLSAAIGILTKLADIRADEISRSLPESTR